MDMILMIFLLLSALAIGLKVYAPVQYLLIGWLVEAAVRAAEQRYKETEGTINRRALAILQIRTMLTTLKMDPDKFEYIIEKLIDAAITRLPKTPVFEKPTE